MLSVSRCREILGPRCQMTDAELERLREVAYVFADIVLRIAREKQDDGLVWKKGAQEWRRP